jgi:integrase
MPRHAAPYLLRKRPDTGYWFYKLKGCKGYKTTGTKNKAKALEVVQEQLAKDAIPASELTLRQYAEPFFIRQTCPRVQHLESEGKRCGNRYLRDQRTLLTRFVFQDPIADKPLEQIRRGDMLAFKSRLLKSLPGKFRTVNRTIAMLKLIFNEAVYREDLDRNPAAGIGNIKYQQRKSGIFTLEELKALFPAEGLGPWQELQDYTAFLLTAATGMRRGEVLALRWMDIDFEGRHIYVRKAWKDRDEQGPPKSGEERITPILLFPERTVARLQQLYERPHSISPMDLVFCYGDGSRLRGGWWKKRFYNALEKAKIERVSRHLTPHGFRRTLNSLLLAANKDSAKIRAALGWKEETTQNGYTQFRAEDLEDLRLD